MAREFHRVLREMGEVVSAANSPGVAWPEIMACLERAVGFDSGFIATTPGPTKASHGAILGHDEAMLRNNVGAYLARLRPSEVSQYLNRARRDSEVWSTQRRHDLAFRYPILSPERARHMLVRVSTHRGQLLGINLERARGCAAFRDEDLALVDAVAPLIQLVEVLAPAPAGAPDLVGLWGLTRREADVAALVVRGLQNHEVAQLLGLSSNTVRNALVRIFEKAHATTRAELTFLAHQREHCAAPVRDARALSEDGVLTFARVVWELSEAAARAPGPARPQRPGLIYSGPELA
jgi:DNA-binding CsgD family transcriptional regulator